MFFSLRKFFAIIGLTLLASSASSASDWERAVKLYNGGDYRAALSEFHDIIRDRPDLSGAWYYIGLCEFKLKRYSRVELPLSRAIDLMEMESPASAEIAGAWYTIGISHYLLSDYAKAVEPLKRYMELSSKARREIDPAARAALGRSYYALERYDEALPLLSSNGLTEKSKANGPSPATVEKSGGANSYYIGAIYFKREDDDRAIAAFKEALRASSEDAASLELLAESLMRKARKTGSDPLWLEAAQAGEQLQKTRDDLRTANILGRAYLGSKQFEKAISPLEKLARAEPENGQGWLYYGIALSRAGKLRRAMEALEMTIQLMPASVPALTELAYVYESDKQYQQALKIYEKAYAVTQDPALKESIERVRLLASQP
jgi:tetratricopeptide (TPR) repeat protein